MMKIQEYCKKLCEYINQLYELIQRERDKYVKYMKARSMKDLILPYLVDISTCADLKVLQSSLDALSPFVDTND